MGSPTLGASIVNLSMQTITHIEILSQPERHTINKAELAVITLELGTFNINTIRKYAIDPLSLIHHPHKDIIKLADGIIRTRDNTGYKTYIGKVKSHTRVSHNDKADTAARNVVESHQERGILFTDADPHIGRGLRTYSQLRTTNRDSTHTLW